jgi:TPR repeat protein
MLIEERQTILKKAELGDGNNQFDLGIMYENGWGVPESGSRAVEWYTKSGENGVDMGYLKAGNIYANGFDNVP